MVVAVVVVVVVMAVMVAVVCVAVVTWPVCHIFINHRQFYADFLLCGRFATMLSPCGSPTTRSDIIVYPFISFFLRLLVFTVASLSPMIMLLLFVLFAPSVFVVFSRSPAHTCSS